MGPFISGCDVELQMHAVELPSPASGRGGVHQSVVAVETESYHDDDKHVWTWAAAAAWV